MRGIEAFLPVRKKKDRNKKEGYLWFFGGEPLLNWKLIERIVKENKRLGYSITTNGSLWTDEQIDFCIEHNVAVSVSIDGAMDVQNKQRGQYVKVMDTVKRFKDRGRPVSARSTFIYDGECRLFKQVKFLCECHRIGLFRKLHFEADLFSTQEMPKEILLNEFAKISDYVVEYEKLGVRLNITNSERIIKIMDKNRKAVLNGKRPQSIFGCSTGRSMYFLKANGDVYPCHRFDGEAFKLGCLDDGLCLKNQKEWTVEWRAKYKEMYDNCKDCEIFSYCKGGCMQEVLLYSEDMKVNATKCLINKEWYKIARRVQNVRKF